MNVFVQTGKIIPACENIFICRSSAPFLLHVYLTYNINPMIHARCVKKCKIYIYIHNYTNPQIISWELFSAKFMVRLVEIGDIGRTKPPVRHRQSHRCNEQFDILFTIFISCVRMKSECRILTTYHHSGMEAVMLQV